MRLCIRHILNIVLLTFIMMSQSSSVHLLKNILFLSLWNLSLTTISDDHVLFAFVYHFINFVTEFNKSGIIIFIYETDNLVGNSGLSWTTVGVGMGTSDMMMV